LNTKDINKFLIAFIITIAAGAISNFAKAEDTSSVAFKIKKYEYRVNKRYKEGKYDEAYKNYEFLFKIDSTKYRWFLDAGMMLYDDMNRPEMAYEVLKHALRHSPSDTLTDLVTNVARSAHFLAKYEEAKKYYRMYNRLTNPKNRPERHNIYIDKDLSDCDYALTHQQVNDSLYLENIGSAVNTQYPEYIPVADANDSVIYFTTRRPENNNGNIDINDNKYFEDMYQSLNSGAGYQKPTKFNILEGITSDLTFNQNLVHKSIVAMSYDGKELFMFKENKLWKSKKNSEGKWEKPKLMDAILNLSKYQTHSSLSPNGKNIYIAAEATNILGNRDIQMATIKEDGTWSIPASLGDSINTPFEENSPTICADGKTLYFSSQGLPGYGGYDIYRSTYENGHWSKPINMGLPINSSGDDLYFNDFTSDGIAYFSSHRMGGYGDQDIYKTSRILEKIVEYKATPFDIALDGSSYAGMDGRKFTYEWNFGDGEIKQGEKINHAYSRPGKYLVKLNTLDENSKIAEYDIPVVIDNVTHIEIDSPDTIAAGQTVKLDGSHSSIKNVKINKRVWTFSNGTSMRDSLVVHKTYPNTGVYTEQYLCRGMNDSLRMKIGYFVKKNIVVIQAEEFAKLVLRREKKEKIRKHIQDSIAEVKKNQRSQRNLSNPFDNVAESKQSMEDREARKKTEKEQEERAFVKQAMANKGQDVALNIKGGFDLANNKLDTANLPEVNLQPIYFDLDKSIIRKDAEETLKRNIAIMKQYPDFVFRISGSTDVRGSEEYNIRLSNKRSMSAIAYLIQNGIPENRITGILSLGEKVAQFKDDSKTGLNEKEYQKDRRVEFSVIGKIIK
jgi:outer membrane protein OmpA-like peptidoglycan-associated protein